MTPIKKFVAEVGDARGSRQTAAYPGRYSVCPERSSAHRKKSPVTA